MAHGRWTVFAFFRKSGSSCRTQAGWPPKPCAEIHAFVPARDFALSSRFHLDLGFTLAWSSGGLAELRRGAAAFLLQDFYVEAHAPNSMMNLLVDDVDGLWARVQALDLPRRYGTRLEALSDKPWGMRELRGHRPSGVVWRIGQVLPAVSGVAPPTP